MLAIDVKNAGLDGNVPLLIENINKFYLNVPYIFYKDGSEKEFQEKMHAILLLTSDYIPKVEEMTNKGRIDNVTIMGNYVYVIELKVDKPSEEALEQIKERSYYKKYLNEGKRVVLLGINFSSETREIESYKDEVVE